MDATEKYISHGRDLRFAFNRFLLDKGLQLSAICEKFKDKEGFGYKAMAKWLPSKADTIKDKSFKPEINSKKQLDRLAECIQECLKASGYTLINSKGEEEPLISDPDFIPFLEPEKKGLRTRKLSAQPEAPAEKLTARGRYEKEHPNCQKFLMLQTDTINGLRKSFLYLNEPERRATLFAGANVVPEEDDFYMASNNTFIINHTDEAKGNYSQLIFQKASGSAPLHQGVYSAFNVRKGGAVTGIVSLIKISPAINEKDPAFLKNLEILLPEAIL